MYLDRAEPAADAHGGLRLGALLVGAAGMNGGDGRMTATRIALALTVALAMAGCARPPIDTGTPRFESMSAVRALTLST